jgi:hypothetical protein
MRTWGGLVGMAGAAPIMDGGFTGAPQSGLQRRLCVRWVRSCSIRWPAAR